MIIDFSQPLRVEVTEEDIKNGKRDNCKKCPVVLALARTLGVKNVDVRWYNADSQSLEEPYYGASFVIAYQSFSLKLPPEVGTKISKYDRSGEMQPFSFEVMW